jgi:starvation-inducible DNA-binding protein
MKTRKINIGLSNRERAGSISLLNIALSNAYLLLIKTKKYHWDVVGPQFMTLNKLWEEHYQSLSLSVDEFAERIRMLGGYPVDLN